MWPARSCRLINVVGWSERPDANDLVMLARMKDLRPRNSLFSRGVSPDVLVAWPFLTET